MLSITPCITGGFNNVSDDGGIASLDNTGTVTAVITESDPSGIALYVTPDEDAYLATTTIDRFDDIIVADHHFGAGVSHNFVSVPVSNSFE